MGYKNKKVTKTRQEPRTRYIPDVGIETYYETVSYETTESVWEPDTSSNFSDTSNTTYGE